MKIGLILGSFNPITVAHLAMVSNLLNSKICDKVLLVVAKHNPWKIEPPAPFELRCKMAEIAIAPFGDACEVCRFEEDIEPPAYSYITIGIALKKYPNDELFLVGGSDTIPQIPNWKNYDTHIKGKIGLIEITRGNKYSSLTSTNKPFVKWINDDIEKLEIQRMDVSSTMIRNMLKDGMNPYPYITENVYNFIKKYNLYNG